MNTAPIILAGGSGFLGTSLADALVARGHAVVILTRGAERATHGGRVRHVHWDAKTAGPWAQVLDGAGAIVNLVGRTVDCRKTPENKRVILASRVDSVRALAAAWAEVKNPPKVWIQSATAHIYGDTWDEVLDESSPIGAGFAPDVGTAWEAELAKAKLPGCRRVVLRISFVLGRNGGALKTMAGITRCFLGGTIGSGRQYISWLHEDDLHAIILRALDDDAMQGIYVATAPEPATNRDFMALLRRTLHRPWSPPTPEPLLRIGAWFLRTDPELPLLGRRLMPTRLIKEGFAFKHPALPEALKDLLAR